LYLGVILWPISPHNEIKAENPACYILVMTESVIIHNIIQTIPLGILVINPQGEIVLCNQSASEILGFSRDDMLGNGWGDLFLESKENVIFNQLLIDLIWNESLNLHRNVPYTRPTGDVRQLSITSSFIRENLAVAGIVILLDDITAILEMHLREKQWLEEINRLEREKVEGLFRLSLAVADQLRNPAMAIGGFARRILKQTGEETTFSDNLRHIIASASRLEDIVKVFTGYIDIPPAKFQIIPVSQLIDQIHLLIKELNLPCVTTRLKVITQLLTISGDPDLINQALLEIIKNAVDNVHDKDIVIDISIFQQNSYCIIEISDNGPGISLRDIPFIFDPFFTTKRAGIGIGLCKVRKIITDLGGILSLENKLQGGAIVKIGLQLSQ
jgi:PAS domain S-box-containing protein